MKPEARSQKPEAMNTPTNSREPRPAPHVNAAAWSAADETAAIERQETVLDMVRAERDCQEALLAMGHHRWTCATAEISPDRKLRVLVEEVGEVAEAIDLLEGALARGEAGGLERTQLRDELVQVAAVAVAWLEGMEAEVESGELKS